ncbi:MAG TPA: sialidase family protein [Dehalococcoidia bacterium]|nr:sialidase family protein [Dehalococcoidia bacterium]
MFQRMLRLLPRLSPGRAALLALAATLLFAGALPSATAAGDKSNGKPKDTSSLIAYKLLPAPEELDLARPGNTGGQFSKEQIERFTCASAGDPTAYVDMSCNAPELGQDFGPDNEIAIAVDPADPDHLLAGSNDYFYRFNNSTFTRQAIVPTGFFTSFDGGETWIDGQIPMRSGNGAGDPSPAFDAKHGVALMAQLENTSGLGGPWVTQGDVSVSRSADGGVTWSQPITVMKGTGAGIGPANQAVFWDKEWLTVDNYAASPHYGRAYLTATRFLNGLHGSYAESPIYLSYSDDGGRNWSQPQEISGSHPSCTVQSVPPFDTECDEDQNSVPEVAANGTLYVHFLNSQNDAAWEQDSDLDSQLMVVKSTDGGVTFSGPFPAVQLEDGLSDMPFSVIQRQTVWGHQIRWNAIGNISVNPTNPDDVVIVFADRGAANPNASDPQYAGCFLTASGGLNIGSAPNYDPCNAGPGADLNVYLVRSTNGGATWSGRTLIDDGGGASQWFPWAGHKSDGTLVVAWDEDTTPAPADTFRHVLWVQGQGTQALGPEEHVDVSATHWAGQYTTSWPAICGPSGYSDPPVTDAAGKDCNVFHGDYTGLAVDSLDRVHVVWTGLNRLVTSPQLDIYTGAAHDGYAQDAMYARR